MFLQGPIVIVAEKPVEGLIQAFSDAGAYPVVETHWIDAPSAIASIKPSAVVITDANGVSPKAAEALAKSLSESEPYLLRSCACATTPCRRSPACCRSARKLPSDR